MATTRFCWTLNNWSDDHIKAIEEKIVPLCKYLIWGKEVGKKGTPHLQGFLILKKRKRLGTLRNEWIPAVGKAAHFEKARGSNYDADQYCKKDGDFKFYGDYPKGKGSRTDIKEFLAAAADGQDDDILAENYPVEYAKYHRAAEKIKKVAGKKRKFKELQEVYVDARLRPWQQEVIEKMAAQDNRKVTWVVDPDGNKGKSWLANYLVAQGHTFLVEGGARKDIAYAYGDEPNVVFDFTRQQEERINYGCIESFKNGRIFSAKYESGLKIFPPAKVLCLSNFEPDRSKLSEDRWDIDRKSVV